MWSRLKQSRVLRPLSPLLTYRTPFDRNERRLVIMSAVIGLVTWGPVYLLKEGVHQLLNFILAWVDWSPGPAFILLPMLAGALIVAAVALWQASFVYFRDKDGRVHALNDIEGDGLERTIALYYTSEPTLDRVLLGVQGVRARWEMPSWSLALRKWIATFFTLGTGGSGGLEGSVTLIGESLAVGLVKPRRPLRRPLRRRHWLILRFWRWWRTLTPDELQTVQLSGVAAAVATLLGAPLAAAFFATEVMYRRRPVIEKLVYALVAALVSFLVGHLVLQRNDRLFDVSVALLPPFTVRYYALLLVLAVAVVAVDFAMRQVRSGMADFYENHPMNPWVRHGSGAVLTGIIAVVAAYLTGAGLDLVLGTGNHAVEAAMAGQITVWVAVVALVAKLLAVMSTITSGGSAGMLVPAIYLGSMVGVIVARVGGYPPFLLVVPAIASSLCALINVPLAAILLTVELFGAGFLLPSLVVLVVTLLLAHPTNVYRTQREEDESREIMPGYAVRRLPVPPPWVGKTLAELELRSRFGVNVIGYLEAYEESHRVHPHLEVTRPLQTGDRLLVLGRDEDLAALETVLNDLEETA